MYTLHLHLHNVYLECATMYILCHTKEWLQICCFLASINFFRGCLIARIVKIISFALVPLSWALRFNTFLRGDTPKRSWQHSTCCSLHIIKYNTIRPKIMQCFPLHVCDLGGLVGLRFFFTTFYFFYFFIFLFFSKYIFF